VSREDSDDELGIDDHPWEWIWADEDERRTVALKSPKEGDDGRRSARKRKATEISTAGNEIVGARMGKFECRMGDTVLLKADESSEAWVGIICDFMENEGDGEKMASFMWFASQKEIRNKVKKRTDAMEVRLHLALGFHRSNRNLERAVYLTIMGRQPARLYQRHGFRHVAPRILKTLSERRRSATE
jgi:origin recognition complex subunit 1